MGSRAHPEGSPQAPPGGWRAVHGRARDQPGTRINIGFCRSASDLLCNDKPRGAGRAARVRHPVPVTPQRVDELRSNPRFQGLGAFLGSRPGRGTETGPAWRPRAYAWGRVRPRTRLGRRRNRPRAPAKARHSTPAGGRLEAGQPATTSTAPSHLKALLASRLKLCTPGCVRVVRQGYHVALGGPLPAVAGI